MGFLRPTSALFEGAGYSNEEVTEEYLLKEFADVQDMEFDYEPTLEGAAAIIAYGQDTFNGIDQEFGMAQLEYFLSNKEDMPINEAFGSGNTYLEKIKYWLIDLGKKIKRLFDKFFAMLGSFVMKDKTFIKKYEGKIKDANTTGFEFKGYNFDLSANVDTARSKLKSYEKSSLDLSVINTHKDKSSVDIKDEMRGSVLGTSKVSASEFGKALFKKFRSGQDSKVDIKTVDKGAIISSIKTAADDKKMANTAYKNIKSAIDAQIKTINNLEKGLKDSDAGTERGDKSRAASLIVEDMKAELEILQTYNGAYLRAIKDRNRQSRAMAVKLMYRKAKESAEDFYGSDSQGSKLFI